MFAAFSTTGFDRHTSLVFNPANPDASIEDCLAAVGDRVARELDAHLTAAGHTLLAGSVCSRHICLTVMMLNHHHCFEIITAYKRLIQNIFHTETELWGPLQQLYYSVLTAVLHHIHTVWGKMCVPTAWQSQSQSQRNDKGNIDTLLLTSLSLAWTLELKTREKGYVAWEWSKVLRLTLNVLRLEEV